MRVRALLTFALLIGATLNPNSAEASQSTVRIFAASSLITPLTKILSSEIKKDSQLKVIPSFASSTSLASQIQLGAPAEIFISASLDDMKKALLGTKVLPQKFLSNHIVLAVPLKSEINEISDLNQKILWIQCAHEVPCGVATDMGLTRQPLNSMPASLEPSASSTLSKLITGSVDAAFVYYSDVILNKNTIRAIEFEDSSKTTTTYYIAKLKNTSGASLLYKKLLSPSRKLIFYHAGFTRP